MEYLAYTDSLKAECCKVKSIAYRQMKLREIDDKIFISLARYAWRGSYKSDTDLTAWMLSFDHNDPDNMELASRYFRWYQREHPRAAGETYFSQIRKAFDNQEMRNIMADDAIVQLLQDAPDDMETLLADYKATSTNTQGHDRADKIFEHYKKMKKGMPAIDFTFQDAKGRKYSLKDFRGKALYIDVWATWCGPCCAEIPHMEKLVEKFKADKRINLISISFDENEKKWLEKLAADKPKWKQFRCPDNFKSALCREYDINGIPRFLMFDAEGNIVSLNAPRPSESRTEEWIRKMLEPSAANSTQTSTCQGNAYNYDSICSQLFERYVGNADASSYNNRIFNGIKEYFGKDTDNRSRFVADYLHDMYFKYPSPSDCKPVIDNYLTLCNVDSLRLRIEHEYDEFYNN